MNKGKIHKDTKKWIHEFIEEYRPALETLARGPELSEKPFKKENKKGIIESLWV